MLLALFLFLQYTYNQADYPGAAGLIIQDKVEVNIDKDYRQKEHRNYKVYIFNTRGREKYGDMFQKYNKRYEDLKLFKTQTVLPDGSIIKPEDKAISDLGTVEGFLAPAYKDMRTRTVSYSAVSPNAVLEYESEKTTKVKSDDKSIFGQIVFRKKDPILNKEFILKIPKSAEIKYQIFGGIKEETKEQGDSYIYRWWADSMPRLKEEPYSIPLEEFAPRVVFTNFKNWQEVGEWLNKKFRQSIVVSGEMKEFVSAIKDSVGVLFIEPTDQRQAIIKGVFKLVTKNWREVPLSLAEVDYTPTKTDETYKNRYGNSVDKCALVVALLKASGIDAYPAYISFSPVQDNLPLPDYFQLMLVAVPEANDFVFLDPRFPEGLDSSFGISGIFQLLNPNPITILPDAVERFAFIIKPDTNLFLTTPEYDKPITNLVMDIVITDDGSIAGKIHSELEGLSATNARANFRHKKEKELEITLEKFLGSLKTGTALKNYEINGLDEPLSTVEISVEFESPDYLVNQGKNCRFNIPPSVFSFFSIEPFLNIATREYPFTVINKRRLLFTINISFPENWTFFYKPEDLVIENDLGLASNHYMAGDNTFTIKKTFAFKKAEYKADEFSALMAIYESCSSINQQFIIFKR